MRAHKRTHTRRRDLIGLVAITKTDTVADSYNGSLCCVTAVPKVHVVVSHIGYLNVLKAQVVCRC